jgi:hypothetical protein
VIFSGPFPFVLFVYFSDTARAPARHLHDLLHLRRTPVQVSKSRAVQVSYCGGRWQVYVEKAIPVKSGRAARSFWLIILQH